MEWATKQQEGVCAFTSMIKDKIIKTRSPGIKSEVLQDINFDGFSPVKLYQQRIFHLHVVMKKSYNFPKKSELSKFILQVKIIVGFHYCAVSEVKMTNLQRSELALVFQSEPARRLCCLDIWQSTVSRVTCITSQENKHGLNTTATALDSQQHVIQTWIL